MENFQKPNSIGSQELLVQFLLGLQRCTSESTSLGSEHLWHPTPVVDTGRQEPDKVLDRPTLWNLCRMITLLYITNIVVVKEIGGNPCVMSANLVWLKDVASVGVVGVREGYQVGYQTVVDIGTSGTAILFLM